MPLNADGDTEAAVDDERRLRTHSRIEILVVVNKYT